MPDPDYAPCQTDHEHDVAATSITYWCYFQLTATTGRDGLGIRQLPEQQHPANGTSGPTCEIPWFSRRHQIMVRGYVLEPTSVAATEA
jgi:hypothetical protein